MTSEPCRAVVPPGGSVLITTPSGTVLAGGSSRPRRPRSRASRSLCSRLEQLQPRDRGDLAPARARVDGQGHRRLVQESFRKSQSWSALPGGGSCSSTVSLRDRGGARSRSRRRTPAPAARSWRRSGPGRCTSGTSACGAPRWLRIRPAIKPSSTDREGSSARGARSSSSSLRWRPAVRGGGLGRRRDRWQRARTSPSTLAGAAAGSRSAASRAAMNGVGVGEALAAGPWRAPASPPRRGPGRPPG